MSLSGELCEHGIDAAHDCEACDTAEASTEAVKSTPENNSEGFRPGDVPAQDLFLDRMRFAAGALLSKPDRALAPEELGLFINGAMALAEMFSEMDRHLSAGAAAPQSWQMDRTLKVDADGLPASQLHIELKAQIESGVMNLVQRFESLGKKTGAKLAQQLGQILVLQGRLVSESVRLAVAHRVKPDQVSGGAPNLMVRGADRPMTSLKSVTTKTGRSADREEP